MGVLCGGQEVFKQPSGSCEHHGQCLGAVWWPVSSAQQLCSGATTLAPAGHLKLRGVSWGGQTPGRKVKDKSARALDVTKRGAGTEMAQGQRNTFPARGASSVLGEP